jgi:Flp pilus assembly pilin Flp
MIGRLNAVLAGALSRAGRVRGSSSGEEGQAFVEYALVLTLVAVGIALLTQWDAFSGALSGALSRIENVVSTAGTSSPSGP